MAAGSKLVGVVVASVALLVTGCSAGGEGTGSRSARGEAVGNQVAALAQPGDSSSPPIAQGITVVGTGRITGEPDTLRTTVGVEVERDNVDAALSAANEATQRVIDAVRGAGVSQEDLQTTEFSVEPRYDHPHEGPPVLRGYVARNLVEVKVRDLERAGEVLTAATEAGGNDARVHGVRFSLEDNQALLEAARERAFEDARSRAQQYAELAGRELGSLVSLSEHLSTPPPAEWLEGGAVAETSARAVPIQPGQQEVEVRATAIWSFG